MTYSIAVIGGQWGDEGKGKVISALAAAADAVVRFGGANNAGHTLVIGGKKYAIHLPPSGVLFENCINIMGKGMEIDPEFLMFELLRLHTQGFYPELRIATQAHIICDWHRVFDSGFEDMLKGGSIGTTRRGVGPCAEDKANRKRAVRFEDIIDEELCNVKMRTAIGAHAPRLVQFHPRLRQFGRLPLDEIVDAGIRLGYEDRKLTKRGDRLFRALEEYAARQIDVYSRCGQFLKGYACPDIRAEIFSKKNRFILYEGAQGFLLDADEGTFPDNTSTSPRIAGVQQYLGVSRKEVDDVVGVFKAYCTRVGNGVFATEIEDDLAEEIRRIGGEYGTTTGRPRRVGWFNISDAKDAVDKEGIDWLAITKLDVLNGLDEILVGERTEDGSITYHKLKGWKAATSHCRRWEDLPSLARKYLKFIEKRTGCRIGMISVGPDKDATIYMPAFRKRMEENDVHLDYQDAA